MSNAAPWWTKTWSDNGPLGLSEVKSSLGGAVGTKPVWRMSDVNGRKGFTKGEDRQLLQEFLERRRKAVAAGGVEGPRAGCR